MSAISKITQQWFPGERVTAARLNTPIDKTNEMIDVVNGIDGLKEAVEDLSTDQTAALRLAEKVNPEISSLVAAQTPQPNYAALPLLCGQPPILIGNGTPQESVVPYNWNQFNPDTGEGENWNGKPTAVGQQYLNIAVSTGGKYTAVRESYDKTSSSYYNLIWKNF